MTTAIDRWRERCDQYLDEHAGGLAHEWRRLGTCRGVRRALDYLGDGEPASPVFLLERLIARREQDTVKLDDPSEFVIDGLRLALEWLKEEVERV